MAVIIAKVYIGAWSPPLTWLNEDYFYNVFHPIASTRHSEPSPQILATIKIWTEDQPITLPKLADGSLCRVLAIVEGVMALPSSCDLESKVRKTTNTQFLPI